MANSAFKTADLCDDHADNGSLQICAPIFRDFGGRISFYGKAHTIACFEDNSLVREAVFQDGKDENGNGKVLVVDGAGSLRHALMGDMLASRALDNGWSGIILNALIRDTAIIGTLNIGVKALCAFPLKSKKQGQGVHHAPVSIAGVLIRDGDYIYADEDGVLCSSDALI